MKKVLVLGGGFAGVEAAIYLRKEKFDVTLVSERDYFYIYPTSIWIPTGDSKFSDVCIPLEDLKKAHGFDLVIDRVTEIRSKENRIVCENNEFTDYDYLVVAIGSGKMKHKGLEHTLSICGKPEESLKIKDAIDALVAKGGGKITMGFGGNPKDTSSVRGGPAFEVLFNVHNMLKKKKIRDKFELTFFAPMEKPGARMGPQALKMNLGAYTWARVFTALAMPTKVVYWKNPQDGKIYPAYASDIVNTIGKHLEYHVQEKFNRCIPALPVVLVITFWLGNKYFKRRSKEITDIETVRGGEIIEPEELDTQVKKEYRGGPYLKLTRNINLPFKLQVRHGFVVGVSGSGKSMFLKGIIQQLRKQKAKAVIFDIKGEYLSMFYDPTKDVVFNPLDHYPASAPAEYWAICNGIG
jgi:hypothetical protein